MMTRKILQPMKAAFDFVAGMLRSVWAKLRLARRGPAEPSSAEMLQALLLKHEALESKVASNEAQSALRLAVLEDGFTELSSRLPRKIEKKVATREDVKSGKHKKK